MQQVLNKAREKDKAVKVILNKKIDNQTKFSGKVSEISDSGFVVTDEKTGTTKRLSYEDVRQVKQQGLSKAAKILLSVELLSAQLWVLESRSPATRTLARTASGESLTDLTNIKSDE